MTLSSSGLSPTCHLAPSVSDVITLSRPCIPPPAVFLEAPFSVLCFRHVHYPMSILLSPLFPWTTTFMQTTPHCFSHFPHPTLTRAWLTYKIRFSGSLPGWLPIITLNSYKTELVAYSFDSKSNLTKYTTPHKIYNSSLNNTHSTPNLGFIFDQHLTFSDQISTTSKASYYHTRLYTASLHSSLTWFHHSWYHCHLRRSLNVLTVILFTTTYQGLRLPASNRSRTLLPALLLKLLNPVISLQSYDLSNGSKWPNALNTNSFYLSTKSSQPPSLHICITSPLFNFLAAFILQSSSLVTLARLPTWSSLRITDRSFLYASPCLWNQIPSSLCQPHPSPSVSRLPKPAIPHLLCQLTTVTIHSSLTLPVPAQNLRLPQIFSTIDFFLAPELTPRTLWLNRFFSASLFLFFF